jgi:hypothetical protein
MPLEKTLIGATSHRAVVNGMNSIISEAVKDAAFLRDYNFEDEKRLHQTMYEAGYHDRSIPLSEVTPNDVLVGKGRRARDHRGSVLYRNTCKLYKEGNLRTSKASHDLWVKRRMIIDEVLSREGRFLAPCSSRWNHWKIIAYDELHKKIQSRLWEEPSTVAVEDVHDSPTSTMVVLDRNRLLDQDGLILDQGQVAPHQSQFPRDVDEAHCDDDRPRTVDLSKAIYDFGEDDWFEHLVWLASST